MISVALLSILNFESQFISNVQNVLYLILEESVNVIIENACIKVWLTGVASWREEVA